MSNYTKSTNFATKDNLPTGDPLKIVKGTEIDTEFNNIATAVSTKTDNASAAITGGSITGITDLAIADGGTGASTATAAINNLLPSQTSNANKYLQTDGTNVSWDAISINTGDITGTLPVANGGTGVTSSTGTGSVVLSNSPTLVTPTLGAATASTLDVSGNVTLSGGTANTIPYLNGSKVVTTGTELYFNGTNLGVGASASYRVDLGSATSDDAAVGIRIGRGGSSTTWSLIDNVGGSGNYRQYSSGTPTLRWLTSTDGSSWSEQMRLNATGLGVGNNNPAAKLDVTGSALVSGSVTATSFAGALNGTVGATTPTTGAFTTVAASGAVTISGGTANGVTYLNGSKVLTSGSALTFDGTNLTVSAGNLNLGNAYFINGRNTANTGYVPIVKVAAGAILEFGSGGYNANFTGSVGIGTSSPAYKLDVANATYARLLTTTYSNGGIINARTSASNGTYNTFDFVEGSTTTAFLRNYGSAYGSSIDNFLILQNNQNAPITFATNATERMRLDSAGNLGLGVTPSAWSNGGQFQIGPNKTISSTGNGLNLQSNYYYNAGDKFAGTGYASAYQQYNGIHSWYTSTASGTAGSAISFTQAMTLDASGQFLLGTTSAIAWTSNTYAGTSHITVSGSGEQNIGVVSTDTNVTRAKLFVASGGQTWGLWNDGSALKPFVVGGYTSEWMRIDSSGNLLVGRTSRLANELVSLQCAGTAGANTNGILLNYTGTPNDTTHDFLQCVDGNWTTTRASIRSNGGIANYSANNVSLSDERTKTDIQDAGNYLAKICAIPVRTFKYKDQSDDLLNLGVIAQEVEAVAPELVDVSGFGETPEDGVPLKAIYQTDLQYALMKALQELKAEFDAYKASHP